MQIWIEDRADAKRKDVREEPCKEKRDKRTQQRAEQKGTVYLGVAFTIEPGPPDRAHDNATLHQIAITKKNNNPVEGPPSLRELIEKQHDRLIEGFHRRLS